MNSDNGRDERPTALQIIAEIKGSGSDRSPPPQSASQWPRFPKSQYDKLCEELGGPADIGVKIDHSALRRYCNEFPPNLLLPILKRFAKNEISARRHWPWAATAIALYKFEIAEREKYGDEPSPDEISKLVEQIRRSSHDLHSGLVELQTLAFRLHEHSAPKLRGHLKWLNSFILRVLNPLSDELREDLSGKAAEDLLDEMKDVGEVKVELSHEIENDGFVEAHLKGSELIKDLARIEAASTTAAQHIDLNSLKRSRPQTKPVLPTFVMRCGQIWTSMTGRKPSANKVHPKTHSKRGSNPKFVGFVRALARVAIIPVPSRKEVETALRKIRTPD
jgi:hypothetical protein